MKYKVLLILSAYEEKVNYERSFYVRENKNKTFGLTSYEEENCILFNSSEDATVCIESFRGLDFNTAFIFKENGDFVKDINHLRTNK